MLHADRVFGGHRTSVPTGPCTNAGGTGYSTTCTALVGAGRIGYRGRLTDNYSPEKERRVHVKETIQLHLNGQSRKLTVDTDRELLWVLRSDLGLTGAKYGCGIGVCGSCTVLVDGRAVRSCRTTVEEVKGKKVITVEGLVSDDELDPVQKAFVEKSALQCGYCTPGLIMGVHGLLEKKPNPTREEIIKGLEGHLCRCGTHVRVIEAVEAAAATMRGAK